MLSTICITNDLTWLTNLLTKNNLSEKNSFETALKVVRKKVVSLEAQTPTNQEKNYHTPANFNAC